MRTRLFGTVAIATLTLAACGGGGGGVQGEVADMMIDELEAEDLDVDESCLRDATSKLSDDDAQKILDAGPDGDAEGLSDEAEAAAAEAIGCIDTGALVDQMIDDMVAEMGEENVDADCIRDATDGLDLANLDEGDGEFMSALFECITIGG